MECFWKSEAWILPGIISHAALASGNVLEVGMKCAPSASATFACMALRESSC